MRCVGARGVSHVCKLTPTRRRSAHSLCLATLIHGTCPPSLSPRAHLPAQCPPGTYNPTPGLNATACPPLPRGYWSNSTALASLDAAQQCPLGTYNPSNSTGATSGSCFPMTCPYGMFYVPLAASGVDCGVCPLGTASPTINATSNATCVVCPEGYATTAPSSAQCVECGAGYYAPAPGTPYCLACPGNAYSAAAGASSCDPCPAYTVSATVGATSVAACVDNSTIGCPPGAAPGPGTSCTLVSTETGVCMVACCSALTPPSLFLAVWSWHVRVARRLPCVHALRHRLLVGRHWRYILVVLPAARVPRWNVLVQPRALDRKSVV